MRKFIWYEENTSTICNMQMIEVEATPNTTLDELRARFPQLYKSITEKNAEFRNMCEQKAAVDYGGSYEHWLKDVLKGCGDVMAKATDLHPYIHANEKRKICLAELARLTEPPMQDPIDTAAGKTYKSSRDEAELTAIFNALTGKTNPKDKKAVFLPADSDLQGWLWICTGILGKQPKEPLKWLGTPTELALMVDKLFGHKWAVTLTWFRYKSDVDGQWKQPTNTFLSKQCKNSTIAFTELGKVLRPFCPDIKA